MELLNTKERKENIEQALLEAGGVAVRFEACFEDEVPNLEQSALAERSVRELSEVVGRENVIVKED